MKDVAARWRTIIVEGSAVLIAILLAFAIDAMWEEHQEKERVRGYLSSLELELVTNRELLLEHLKRLRRNQEETDAYIVTVATESPDLVSPEAVRKMVWEMGPASMRAIPLQRAALEDLTSGELQSVPDARVRRLILAYSRGLDFDGLRQRGNEDWFASRANPYNEIYADLVGMRSEYSDVWTVDDDVLFEFDTAAFIGNRRYGNLLASRAFQLQTVIRAREQLLADLEELLSALKGPG